MDVFDEELLKLWRNLNTSEVEYIMIGGIATNLHAKTSFSAIIEIWINEKSNNLHALLHNLKEEYDPFIFESENKEFNHIAFEMDNLLSIHLITKVKGLEDYTFEESLKSASIADILDLKVPFLHINQLIESKKAANRPKDQIDVMALEKIKKLREEER